MIEDRKPEADRSSKGKRQMSEDSDEKEDRLLK
jgi:hypothetical protein